MDYTTDVVEPQKTFFKPKKQNLSQKQHNLNSTATEKPYEEAGTVESRRSTVYGTRIQPKLNNSKQLFSI